MTHVPRPHVRRHRLIAPVTLTGAVVAGCALVLLVGCDGSGDAGVPESPSTSASPSVSSPATGSATPVSPSVSPPPPSASPLSPSQTVVPTTPRATPAESPTTTPVPTDPDRSGDLVRGFRNLTGTVQAGAGCAVLLVSDERWALTGRQASTLRAGEDVQVRGRVVAVPRGCPAAHALEVTQLRRLR